MSDIDERLEEEILHAFRKSFDSQQAGINANFLMDIQREIERLRADLTAVTEERDRMREALKPFADAVDIFIAENHDAHRTIVTLGDFFHARAALEGVTEPSSPWRDIESAPRDGTSIEVWDESPGAVNPSVVFWENGVWVYADNLLADAAPDGALPSHWRQRSEPPR